MKTKNLRHFGVLTALLSLALVGCGTSSNIVAQNGTQAETQPVVNTQALANDWRKESIYFVVTDRFANGNTANDNGSNTKPGDASDKNSAIGWHGGDLAGLKQKINEGFFTKMGFTALWLTPVYLQVPPVFTSSGPNNGKYHAGYAGYWAEDFSQVDPHMGNLQDLKDVVTAAHAKGLKVVQDMVVNHAGYEANIAKQHPDWFNSGAGCSTTWNDVTCPLAGLPDFNQQNGAAKTYLNDATRFWVTQTGIDGIRMDTMKHAFDDYWPQYFAANGPADNSKVWTVGEVFAFDPSVLSKYLNLGSPSVFDFPLYGAIRDSIAKGGSLDAIGNVLAQDNKYSDASRLTTFIDNHDVRRFMSEGIEVGIPFNQQQERLDGALSLIFTVRGTPSVYYGSEIAMQGKGDPYNEPANNNRQDMNFAGVDASPITARLTALNAARKAYPALTNGAQNELWKPGGGTNIYAFSRTLSGSSAVVVVLNGSDNTVDLGSLGGISLNGALSGSIKEITGRSSNLSINSSGKLVGTIPPRTLLAVSTNATVCIPPAVVPNPSSLVAQAGSSEVNLSWTAPVDCALKGYNVYFKASSAATFTKANTALNTATSFKVTGLTNNTAYDFKVTTVSNSESTGATVTATPKLATGLTVHFKKPALWGGANIHYWNSVPATVTATTWPGLAMTAETCGYYTYTIANASASSLLFVDPSNTARKTADLSRTLEGWFDGDTNTWSNTAPSCPVGTKSAVTFKVIASTTLGQSVFLAGDATELGAWNTASSVAMTSSACTGTTCTWTTAPISLDFAKALQFKFIKKAGATVTWETGANRTFTVPSSATALFDGASFK